MEFDDRADKGHQAPAQHPLSRTRQPLILRGLAFSSMFVWLFHSMYRVSRSRTNDEITLDTNGLKDWAAI